MVLSLAVRTGGLVGLFGVVAADPLGDLLLFGFLFLSSVLGSGGPNINPMGLSSGRSITHLLYGCIMKQPVSIYKLTRSLRSSVSDLFHLKLMPLKGLPTLSVSMAASVTAPKRTTLIYNVQNTPSVSISIDASIDASVDFNVNTWNWLPPPPPHSQVSTLVSTLTLGVSIPQRSFCTPFIKY